MDTTYIPFAIRLAINRIPDSHRESKIFMQAALEGAEAIFEDDRSQYNMEPSSVAPDKTAVARPHGVKNEQYDIPTSLEYAKKHHKKGNMEGTRKWLEYAKGLANAMPDTSAKNSYLNQIKTVDDSLKKPQPAEQSIWDGVKKVASDAYGSAQDWVKGAVQPTQNPKLSKASSSVASSSSNTNRPPEKPSKQNQNPQPVKPSNPQMSSAIKNPSPSASSAAVSSSSAQAPTEAPKKGGWLYRNTMEQLCKLKDARGIDRDKKRKACEAEYN
jgi:hypothetical protein